MEKTKGKHSWFTKWFVAFLAIAIVFLAVGLGTLGSTETRGEAYELKSGTPEVIVQLNRSGKETYVEGGTEKTRNYTLEVRHIYVDVAAVYAEAGTPGVLRMQYASATNSFSTSSRYMDVAIENFFTKETEAEPEENAEQADEKQIPVCKDALFRWTAPFDEALSTWTSSHTYVRFTALTRDLIINEIVFVGEKMVDSKPTGELMVIPATVEKATPYGGTEKPEEAAARAGALFDAQKIPSGIQSSYANYTRDELYTLSTLTEMHRGGEYDESLGSSAYHVEGVYNSLGVDLIALSAAIFGTSPFAIRFFPMLASLGVLVFGYLFVLQLTKREKAGVAFAALYALSGLSMGLGHVGTPLMIGIFFFMASLYFCHRFYARGMRKAGVLGTVPLVLSGLFGAAAICVNGVYILPVAGVAALFAAGLVRQQKAKRYYLNAAIERAEAPGAAEEEREAVVRVVQEYRAKNLGASVGFGLTLVLFSVFFSLVFAIPLYTPYLRLYTTATSANIFTLAAKAFAGGFVGCNPGVGRSAWTLFAVLFEGTGARYAVTALAVNAVAAVAGVLGIAFAVYRIVRIALGGKPGKEQRGELRTLVVPLAGLILSLVLTFFGGGAFGFLMLTYIFAFALAAHAVSALTEGSGKLALAAKICAWIGLGLLIAVFALYAIFTFSIPVPASLMTSILG